MTTALTAPARIPVGFGTAHPDGVYPRTVRHFGGETSIVEEPSRFVAISTGNLDGAIALGVVPAASTHNDSGGFIPDYLRTTPHAPTPDIGPALDDVIDIGLRTEPDLELIGALQPTLITASRRGYGGKNYHALSALGPTVLPEGKGFNWKQDLLLLSAALGRTERADTILDVYHAHTADIADRYRRAGSPRISVARFGPQGLETHGTWSFCGSILTDIGATRPAGQSRHDNGTRIDLSGPTAHDDLALVEADLILYTRVDLPSADRAWDDAAEAGWEALPVQPRRVEAAPWHGHAGVLAALAVLTDLSDALT